MIFVIDINLFLWFYRIQVRGELPFQKCKAALDSVEFSDKMSAEELGSTFADVITQLAQDVSI